jgi:hypothetical protein
MVVEKVFGPLSRPLPFVSCLHGSGSATVDFPWTQDATPKLLFGKGGCYLVIYNV